MAPGTADQTIPIDALWWWWPLFLFDMSSTLQALNIERTIDRLEAYRRQLDAVMEEARQQAENLEFDMEDLLLGHGAAAAGASVPASGSSNP